jgi:hypothetical protein
MAYENRPNSGALFKNDKKGDNPKAPNLKGRGLLELDDGSLVELDIAAWTRESRTGQKFWSLSIKLKDADRQHDDQKRGKPLDDDDVF